MNGLFLPLSPFGRYEAGEALVRCPRVRIQAGEPAEMSGPLAGAKFCLVEWGFVLVAAARSRSRKPVVISLAGEGALLPPLAADEQLIGLTDAAVIAVSEGVYEALLCSPGTAAVLVEGLLEALRERQESLANASGARHDERLRGKLCQLARLYGRVSRDGIELELPLTHELLARMIGSARETVTSTLSQFQREGFLVRSGRGYRIRIAPGVLEAATSTALGSGSDRSDSRAAGQVYAPRRPPREASV